MSWTGRIALAVLFALVAGAVARADNQPKYATMNKSWSPYGDAQPQPPAPIPPAPVPAPQQQAAQNPAPLQQQQSLPPQQQPMQQQAPTRSAASDYDPQDMSDAQPIARPQQQVVPQQRIAPPPQAEPMRDDPPPMRMASVRPQSPFGGGNSVGDYRLGTGDKVRVTVYGEDDLSGEFQVDSTGFLRLPMIGQIRAAGLNSQTLEGAITQAYAQGYLLAPRVNVEITVYRPFYIIGEVNKPGEYAYVNGMNVLNAIALAGGYTQKAAEAHVYLRKNGTSDEIKVASGDNIQIMPGDIVRVGSNPLWDVLSIVGPLAPFAPRY
ncbi:MAG TPA: polysaccharide biosynthesis/export family protein [Rhizomicrobium sp.]|jgi:polysaccharide export outer membrane protein|nr:polysaccharide biosynthesis/export family protein [Rhizomicrobium sp.]